MEGKYDVDVKVTLKKKGKINTKSFKASQCAARRVEAGVCLSSLCLFFVSLGCDKTSNLWRGSWRPRHGLTAEGGDEAAVSPSTKETRPVPFTFLAPASHNQPKTLRQPENRPHAPLLHPVYAICVVVSTHKYESAGPGSYLGLDSLSAAHPAVQPLILVDL